MRDFVPERIMGRYFGRRMAIATALGAGLSMASGIGIDLWKAYVGPEMGAYAVYFVIGGLSGLIGTFFIARIPEPRMVAPTGEKLLSVLSRPFRDPNYRQLIKFLAVWNFAVNLAGPFFAVYMLRRLELSMTWVIGLSVISQLFNVLFLRIWGALADRYSNTSVLTVSGPLFMVTFLLWPFTTLPEVWSMTIPLVVLIHILSGVSAAGVTLCTSNLALKSAPRGAATAYLATNALVSGIAASLAPILGGLAAAYFADKELTLTFAWAVIGDEMSRSTLPAFDLRGLDFLFIMAFLLGLYAIHRELAVKEEGEVEERVILTQLYVEVSRTVRHVSNIPGLKHLTHYPYGWLRKVMARDQPEEPDGLATD